MKRFWVLLGIAFAVLAIDVAVKAYVHRNIPIMGPSAPFYPYGGIGVFYNVFGIDFSINHAINRGAAWGMLANFQKYLLYVRIIVIAAMIGYLFFFNKDVSRAFPFTLIIAGALGNVIDTVWYGHVIDLFHFKFGTYSFPIFNIADSAIFCAVAWLIYQSCFENKRSQIKSV